MRMEVYIAKRTCYALLTLLALSTLVFILARVLPGDPALMAAGPRAPDWVVEKIREELNLDKPLYIQYILWFKSLLKGDLGYSIHTRRSVTHDVLELLPASMEIILLAAVFEVVGAFILGTLAGRYANKLPDYLTRFFAYIGISMPAFAWAIIFQLLFTWMFPIFPTYGRLSAHIVPPPRITGFLTIDSLITGRFDVFRDALWHMVLPALALCIGGMAQDARIIRSGMVENAGKDYIALARAFGLPERLVMFKYLLKPSIIPAVTVMGMDVASLLSNAFVVEIVYGWPGFSKYGIETMLRTDLNAIVAVVLVIGLIYVVANIIVDVIVAYLDPRIRLVERGE